MQLYLRLLSYLKPYWLAFAISIAGFALFAISQPMLAKLLEIIVEAIEAKDYGARWTLPVLAVGLFLFRGVGFFLGAYYNAFVGSSVVRDLKAQVFDHLTVLPADYFLEVPQGQLLHRLNSGVEQIRAAVTKALKILVSEGLTIIALLMYVFYLNWRLSLVFLLVTPALVGMVSYANKRFRRVSKKNEAALGSAMQVSKELISNYGVVRSFGAVDYEIARYKVALDTAFKMQMKIRKVQAIMSPFAQVIIAIAVAVIVFFLLQPDTLHNNTTGELIGYLTAVGLIPRPMRQLSGVALVIQKGLVGAELVFDILDQLPEEDSGYFEKPRANGKISFKNVTFAYPKANGNALTDIDFEIPPRSCTALVGKSGSGKTTLAALLQRIFLLDGGGIYIDDVDINAYKLKNLRQHISVVDQNVALFNASVRSNIAYGDREYSDEIIELALTNAYALDFVNALPEGVETQLGENGVRLSGGQRQRLSIARAFLKNAPILILDEATSALDNESEVMVQKALFHVMDKRTTIIIAHRLSTIQSADNILVMDEGRIVEAGTYQELLNAKSYFYRLSQSGQQF